MAVNQEIYKDKYKYLKGDIELFTTTDTLPNIITNEPIWQQEQVWDNSNVYSTVDPSLNNIRWMGCQAANVQIHSENEINSAMTSSTVTSVAPTKVNLRYLYQEYNGGANLIQGSGLRWKGSGQDLQDYIKGTARTTTDPNWFNGSYGSTDSFVFGSVNNTPTGMRNWQFVNDINRNALFFAISFDFCYVDDNGGVHQVDIPIEEYRPGEPGFNISTFAGKGFKRTVDGAERVVFVNGLHVETYVKNPFFPEQQLFGQFQGITKRDLDTMTDTGVYNGNTSASMCLTLLAERVVGDSLYYFNIPLIIGGEGSATVNFTYQRGEYRNNNKSYPVDTVSDIGSNVGSYIKSYDDKNDFNHLTSMFPLEEGEYEVVFSVVPNTGDKFFVQENGQLIRYYTPADTIQDKRYQFWYPLTSVEEIVQMFACTLIPFTIRKYTSTVVSDINKTLNPYSYIGVREADGNVAGNYKNYEWKVDEAEGEFRPEDYEPVDPNRPDGGDDDEEDPDKIGEHPEWDNSSPTIGFASYPLPLGFINFYALDSAHMQQLGQKLWAGLFSEEFMENIWTALFNTASLELGACLKYFPMCKMFPVDLTSDSFNSVTQDMGRNLYFARGTAPIAFDNDVGTFKRLKSPFVNCGDCEIHVDDAEDWNDLEPFTTAQVYVPFCGMFSIPVADIIGSTIHFAAYMNVVSGEISVTITRTRYGVTNYLMTVTGSCSVDIPLSSDSMEAFVAKTVATAVPAIVAGGIGAASAASTVAGAGAGMTAAGAAEAVAAEGNVAQIMNAGMGASNAVGSTLNATMTGGTSGVSMAATGGFMNVAAPAHCYIYLRKTQVVRPTVHGHSVGYPYHHTSVINECSGWTVCINPDTSGIAATAKELEELHRILTSGFFA